MGKPRSGRKAWRGIDSSAVEDAHATAAQRAKSGADVASLPDDALFFVDATAAPGAAAAARSRSRRSRQPRSLRRSQRCAAPHRAAELRRGAACARGVQAYRR
jgi:hypothetical protein